MTIGLIEDGFYISAQIMPDQLVGLAAQGIKSIINNRPDGERGFYPSDAEMAQLACDHGMEYRSIPVNPMALTMDSVTEFANAMAELPWPVVGYCASGRRSAMMWALANAGSKSADEIITACAAQGHDLNQMRPMLIQIGQAA